MFSVQPATELNVVGATHGSKLTHLVPPRLPKCAESSLILLCAESNPLGTTFATIPASNIPGRIRKGCGQQLLYLLTKIVSKIST
jgi:hypothetical protein